MTTFTVENAEKLIECSKQGLSKIESGKKIGVSDKQVLRILDRFNIRKEYDDNVKTFITNEYYHKIIDLYLKGLTINLISHELNRKEEFICENLYKAFNEKIIRGALCENSKCNEVNDYSYATGRFCSSKCSKSFSTSKMTVEDKLKRSVTLKAYKNSYEKFKKYNKLDYDLESSFNKQNLIPYGYVYKITNKINGKTYVGCRNLSLDKSWRQYMGSGHLIKQAMKNYGEENFTKEFLGYC